MVLQSNKVTLAFCNYSGCSTVTATLKQTSPGTYTYSFTLLSSLTCTITLYAKAYALADDNGRIFPQVDTSIGTYAYTAPTGSSVSQLRAFLQRKPSWLRRFQVKRSTQNPTPTTQPVTQPTGRSPIEPLLITLSVLAVAGFLLTVSTPH